MVIGDCRGHPRRGQPGRYYFDLQALAASYELEYIALMPGGGYLEAVLHHIACHLRLDRIELRALEDIREQKPSLLLDPTSDEWTSGSTNTYRYTIYEDAFVRFALGKASRCPPLAPAQYLSESEGQEWQ